MKPLLDAFEQRSFPLNECALQAISHIKKTIASACLSIPLQNNGSIVIETDASNSAIRAVMSQAGRPIAYFSKSLSMLQQKHYSTVEREALAIVEAARKWQQFVRCFPTIIKTDQKSVSFIFAPHKSKIKNEKLLRWRLELSEYQYDIQYRPGIQNEAADALSRIASVLPTCKFA